VTLRASSLALLLAASLLAVPGARAWAQGAQWQASVVASVDVAPPPILITTIRDLEFGRVGPGMVVDVPAQPPYAPGTWAAGARFTNIRKTDAYGIRFTLPTQLVSGTATLPVSFAGTSHGWICAWSSTPSTCNALSANVDPSTHTTVATAYVLDIPNGNPGNDFTVDVYVGGVLTVPGGSVKPGVYTATLGVTVTRLN
jgi:hypothetical protein